MSDIVNLNRFRKKKIRAEKERRAEENRAKFGRTKADKASARLEEERRNKLLSSHQRAEKGDEIKR